MGIVDALAVRKEDESKTDGVSHEIPGRKQLEMVYSTGR